MVDEEFDFSGLDTTPKKKDFQKEIEIYVKDLFDEMDNMSDEQVIKKRDCSLLLEEYLSMFHRTVEDDYTDIVPAKFTLSEDIDKKIEILKDCLNQAIQIKDSSVYIEMLAGYRGQK